MNMIIKNLMAALILLAAAFQPARAQSFNSSLLGLWELQKVEVEDGGSMKVVQLYDARTLVQHADKFRVLEVFDNGTLSLKMANGRQAKGVLSTVGSSLKVDILDPSMAKSYLLEYTITNGKELVVSYRDIKGRLYKIAYSHRAL